MVYALLDENLFISKGVPSHLFSPKPTPWSFQIPLSFHRSSRRKTSRSKEENHQKQTQPIYAATSGNQTQDTLVGGEP